MISVCLVVCSQHVASVFQGAQNKNCTPTNKPHSEIQHLLPNKNYSCESKISFRNEEVNSKTIHIKTDFGGEYFKVISCALLLIDFFSESNFHNEDRVGVDVTYTQKRLIMQYYACLFKSKSHFLQWGLLPPKFA